MRIVPGFDASVVEINVDPDKPYRAVLTLADDDSQLDIGFDIWHLIDIIGRSARAAETMCQRPRVQAWMHDNAPSGFTAADVNTCIRKVLA